MRQIALSFFKQVGTTVFALCFVLNTTAWAGKIFNWNNDVGHTHFTDYRSSIPLKYRDQIKDEVDPPKIIMPKSTLGSEMNSEGTSETKEEGQKKEGLAQQEGEEEKKNDMTMDEELAKLLIEAVELVNHNYSAFRRFLRAAKFDAEQGRYFVMLVLQTRPKQEKMAARLEEVKHKTLQRLRNFFLDSLSANKDVDHGRGPKYLRMLEDLESRIKQEQDRRLELEKALRADLKAGGVTDEIAIELGGQRFGSKESESKDDS